MQSANHRTFLSETESDSDVLFASNTHKKLGMIGSTRNGFTQKSSSLKYSHTRLDRRLKA